MLLFSADHGHTLVDNYDDHVIDEEKDLWAEVHDLDDGYDQQAWSGAMWDFWSDNDSSYVRPNIFA
jgi:hypothetical protein